MKKLVTLLYAFIALTCVAQVETNYYAKDALKNIKEFNAHKYLNYFKTFPSIKISNHQIEKSRPDTKNDSPLHYCTSLETNYSLSNGYWIDIDSGRLWFITFESYDANSLSFVFNNLHLSSGATLYIVNNEGTTLYGPVKNESVQNDRGFLTDVIDGSVVTIILFEPNGQDEKSSLIISRVNQFVSKLNDVKASLETDCLLDVACISGWDFEADGIGRVLTSNGYGGSGALIMTTNRSFKGYFLTAKHVVDAGELYSVTFFYRRKTCNGNQQYTKVTCNNIVVRASWGNSDMALLEILDLPINNQKLTWLGWDRSGALSGGATCLHHPYGFYPTKIAKELDPIETYSSNNNYWDITFDVSTTVDGSSGAPLLDSHRRIIGVLKGTIDGGSNECENLRKSFGKFSKFWTGGHTNSSRLANWLDPTGTGFTVVNSSRLHAPFLSGPSSICYGATGTYTIGDVPPNASMTWSFTGLNSGITLPMQIIGDTCAIITNNSSQSFEGLVSVKIEIDGYTLTTLKKNITIFGDFYGYYISGSLSSNFNLGVPLIVERNVPTYIETTNFRGMDVTWNNLYTNPTDWYYDGDQVLRLVYPQNGSGPLIVQASALSGLSTCGNFQIYLYGQSSSYNLNLENRDNFVIVSLLQSENKVCDEQKGKEWTLEAYDSVTGERVFREHLKDFVYSVDITGWKAGIYLIRVIIDNEALSGKFMIK